LAQLAWALLSLLQDTGGMKKKYTAKKTTKTKRNQPKNNQGQHRFS
jgi:hypothetical protein